METSFFFIQFFEIMTEREERRVSVLVSFWSFFFELELIWTCGMMRLKVSFPLQPIYFVNMS